MRLALALGLAIGGPPLVFSPAHASAGEKNTLTATASVDLNRASVVALERLPGVGPKRARAIVARRERRRFRTVEELRSVRGFGPKLFQRLRPMLRAGP